MNKSFFAHFSKGVAKVVGKPGTFVLMLAVVLTWAVTGPIFHFSDTWQLVINTGTTIITFLMVFIIQNTQNRDTEALQLKLDELLRISSGHNALMDLEELTEEDLDRIKREYGRLAAEARQALQLGKKDTNRAEVEAGQLVSAEIKRKAEPAFPKLKRPTKKTSRKPRTA